MKRRLRAWWGRFTRLFPLRVGALLLLGLALLLIFFVAPEAGDVLLYPAALVAAGLIAACAAVVIAGALRLRAVLKRRPAGVPEALDTHAPTGTGFSVPGAETSVPERDGQHAEVVTLTSRGRFTSVTRRFTVGDVFGLARISFDLTWPVALRVTPATARHGDALSAGRAQGDALANPTGTAEGDLVEMRQYAHGDPTRHILWKVYARSRKLLVRMPERALAPGPVNVAFFVAGPEDEASAGAARLYLEAGLLGTEPIFSADGATEPAHSAADGLDQLVDSARQRAHGAGSLEALAAQINPARLHACLFFAPPLDGPWRPRMVDFIRARGMEATVIIGVDEAGEAPPPAGRVRAWLFQPPPTLDSQRPTLSKLKQTLEAEGLPVKILHRATGQLL